ncbi:MAG: VOC family protein [Hyphomonadaceae bacterium]|nr:VOC family protein [Hyphomonadaceae bacterium]
MIGYQMVGTNNLDKAVKFYDALMGEMGAQRMMEEEGSFVAWARDPKQPAFSVCKPQDGNNASIGNGSMTAFAVETPAQVDKLYAKAIELGATDEGPAGPRGSSFYAGYCRDLDGNKFNFFCMGGS